MADTKRFTFDAWAPPVNPILDWGAWQASPFVVGKQPVEFSVSADTISDAPSSFEIQFSYFDEHGKQVLVTPIISNDGTYKVTVGGDTDAFRRVQVRFRSHSVGQIIKGEFKIAFPGARALTDQEKSVVQRQFGNDLDADGLLILDDGTIIDENGVHFFPDGTSMNGEQFEEEVEDFLREERCFAAGTCVRLIDGSERPIELLEVGDLVSAFDSSDLNSTVCQEGRRVSALHTRIVEETLDFHGTIVTPGHVFLSGDGTFKKIADILEEDGTVVRDDGTIVRARTNCPVGTEDDRVLPITYNDTETGELVTTSIRAGAPFAAEGDNVVTVSEAMRSVGYELGADGLFIDIDGNKTVAHWPWGEPEPTNLAENRVSFA